MSEEHWNNSKLACLERCGEQFRRRHVEGERSGGGVAAKRGTAVHAVAAEAHRRQKAAKDEAYALARGRGDAELVRMMPELLRAALPSGEEARDLAAAAFDADVRVNGVTYSAEDQEQGVARVRGRARDAAVAMSAYYVERVAPPINPVAFERHIEVRPPNSDLVIHGTLDLITAQLPQLDEDMRLVEGLETIRDQKTSERSPRRNMADTSQQLSMYAMIRWSEVGRPPERLVLDYVVRTRERGDLRYVPLYTTRDVEDVRALTARLSAAVRAARLGAFVPTDPSNWWCSPRWCEFYSTCRYVRRPVSVTVPEEEEA